MKTLLSALAAVLFALCAMPSRADASVVIGGTRVIFPAAAGEVTVRLNNNGAQPALVEAWIDAGDPASTPDTAHVPFLITPPLFRMNAGKGQSLRIVYTGQPLPTDRESLYWLNVLEVPPKPVAPAGEVQNTLQFAVRSRLKLFFRPANLTGSAADAAARITWTVASTGHGQALVAHNASAYYVTFSQATLTVGNSAYAAGSAMVAPGASQQLPLKDVQHAPAAGGVVDYTTVNDFGATESHKGAIAP